MVSDLKVKLMEQFFEFVKLVFFFVVVNISYVKDD